MKILIVDEIKEDSVPLKEELKGNEVKHVSSLQEAFRSLEEEEFNVILLDLNLIDSHGISTVKKATEKIVKGTPIIVMTGLNDEDLGLQAVQLGADDYLVKGRFDGHMLIRSIKYSIERSKLRKELIEMSLFDDLTGLYNRRGFKTLVEQKMKEAKRLKQDFVLFLIDLDQMKQINDQFGHIAGDLALIDTAKLLRKTFREADILTRWGGDEFVVLSGHGASEHVALIKERLERNLNEYNETSKRDFKLSMSIGDVVMDHEVQYPIEELLIKADKKMYQEKAAKKRTRTDQEPKWGQDKSDGNIEVS